LPAAEPVSSLRQSPASHETPTEHPEESVWYSRVLIG
jgi:hypothetical protein